MARNDPGARFTVELPNMQAVAAPDYGPQAVPAVDRIVGPGNAYVTAALVVATWSILTSVSMLRRFRCRNRCRRQR